MGRFPADAPKRRVIGALQRLGFRIVREAEHIAMQRENSDGTRPPLTLPNIPSSRDRRCARFAASRGLLEMTF